MRCSSSSTPTATSSRRWRPRARPPTRRTRSTPRRSTPRRRRGFSRRRATGAPLRSRVEYVVVFHAPRRRAGAPARRRSRPPRSSAPSRRCRPTSRTRTTRRSCRCAATGWSSPRGLGDVRIKRELLEASPRQQTSEMLSAAPGFFVDHEDGEGLGNDVYLRGFDLDHGSGIEMRVGSIPINIPTHIQGQGYADANFIIPEVVRSIRVLEGPYDPRQGDAAIVGSAYFDLGVAERGYQLKTTYGSFDQARVVGIAAPPEADEETFAAFALRSTDGFGQNRACRIRRRSTRSTASTSARAITCASSRRPTARARVAPGRRAAGRRGRRAHRLLRRVSVLRRRDQGVQSSRVILGADFDHVTPERRALRVRAVGHVDRLSRAPELHRRHRELADRARARAAWATSSRRRTSRRPAASRRASTRRRCTSASCVEVAAEPGRLRARGPHRSDQEPARSGALFRRGTAASTPGSTRSTRAAYVDVDLRLGKRLRVSGGLRADLLVDVRRRPPGERRPRGRSRPPARLPGARRRRPGRRGGPARHGRSTTITPSSSRRSSRTARGSARSTQQTAGRGGRAVLEGALGRGGLRAAGARAALHDDAGRLRDVGRQRARVRGRRRGPRDREREHSPRRRRFRSSPSRRLAARVDRALGDDSDVFATLSPGVAHYVPNVPPILFRADVTARGTLAEVGGTAR